MLFVPSESTVAGVSLARFSEVPLWPGAII